MLETIKSYLVSLGFNVDKSSYETATKAMDNVDGSVAKFAGNSIKQFALAGAAVTTFVATTAIGIAKFIDGLAQADLANEKLARQLWMNKDAATAYNATLKAMGVTLEDLYLSPELMKNFQTLNQEARNLRPPTEFAEQMKLVRSVQFEFTRMKLEATYALQWIGYYFVKYMEGPIKEIKRTLSEINSTIVKTMPSWTKIIAQVMSWFARMGVTTFRAFKDIIRVFNEVGSVIPKNLKLIGGAITALAVIIQTGPLGILMTTLTSLLILLDDFYTYLDGGESAFGPFWSKLEGFYNKLKGNGFFDDFKNGWKDAVNWISEFFDSVGKETAKFYKDLEDNGAIKNFEDGFKNTFDIIGKLFTGAKIWVQDLFKELEKQGVLKDLKNSFEEVIVSVSELFDAVVDVVKKLLELDETEDTLNTIGKILNTTIIVALQTINELLKGIAGYTDIWTAIFRGNAREKAINSGEDAQRRLASNPEYQDQGFWEGVLQTGKEMITDYFEGETNFSDKIKVAAGAIARIGASSPGNESNSAAYGPPAPSYIYPQSTQNNNSNTSIENKPSFNIYSSDAKSGMDAATRSYESMLMRNMSGVMR